MKNLLLSQYGTGQRITFIYRIILALIAGHLITIGGEFQNLSELIKLPGYPVALLSSVLIAIVAIEQVNYSIVRLYRRYPTYEKDYTKVRWQLINCVLKPFITIFILATIYYAFHGYFILDTMWPADNGWQILFMLLVLNMIFGIAMTKSTPPLKLLSAPKTLLPFVREITHIMHDNGINKIHYDNDTCELDRRSLYDLGQTLDLTKYVLNPKSSILRLDNIKVAGDNPEGIFIVELIYPRGMLIAVSDRQRKFYSGYLRKN
jgi:hypothetical protein